MTFTVTVGGHVGYGSTPYSAELAFTLVNTTDGVTSYGPTTVDSGTGLATFPVEVAGVYAVHVHDTHSPARISDQYCSGGRVYLAGFSDTPGAVLTVPLTITTGAISAGASQLFKADSLSDLVLPAASLGGHVYVIDNPFSWTEQGPGTYTVDVMTDATTIFGSGQEYYTPALIADFSVEPGAFLIPVPADGTHFAIRVTRVADGATGWLLSYSPANPNGGVAADFAGATKWVYEPTSDVSFDRAVQVGHETDPDYPRYMEFSTDYAWPGDPSALAAQVGSDALRIEILPGPNEPALTFLSPILQSWAAEQTQALAVTLDLSAVLDYDVHPTDPPTGLETDGPDIIHFDFDDELVLDDNGRPV